MALKKDIKQENGLILSYHMIAKVDIEPNQQVSILVHSYLDESARQYEKDYADGKIEGEPEFPYYNYHYYQAEYTSDFNLLSAYEWLKTNVEDFADAEDC